jgi:DEAD/DEAH box helicase
VLTFSKLHPCCGCNLLLCTWSRRSWRQTLLVTCAGKTLAFGLPALRHIQKQRACGVVSGNTPVAVCIAPTRELAQQIAAVLADAGAACGCTAVCVYGGHPKHVQAKALRGGAQIVVGTPGRMLDLMQDGVLQLEVRAALTPPCYRLGLTPTRQRLRRNVFDSASLSRQTCTA